MNTTALAPGPGRRLERSGALGGVAYVILFIGGVILSASGQPDTDAQPAKVIAYYSDSGHRDKIFFGWLLILLGVFCLLWFIVALRQLLRRVDGTDGFLTNLATLGGTVYAALTLMAASVVTALKTMSDDTFQDQVFPELIHAGDDAAYVIHSAGGVGIGALIFATSVAVAGAGLIPRWAGVVGIITGIFAILSIFFLPQILVALWLLVASWLLYRAASAPAAGVPPVR